MQAATVGVAFGVQSDITSEAADAVILETSLGRVDELIHIARAYASHCSSIRHRRDGIEYLRNVRCRVRLPAPIGGAITQEIIDLAAVLNAVRVALPTHTLTDF